MTTRTPPFWRTACVAVLAALGASAAAAGAPLDAAARAAIEQFLATQAAGTPGKVSVRVQEPASALPSCGGALQPFLPRGVAAWGRVSVGLRCAGERPWTRFLAAQVAVEGTYLAAARAVRAGESLAAADLVERHGDLTRLPRSVLTDASMAAGLVAVNPIAAGAPLRADQLRGAVVVRRGEVVRVVAQGPGFAVSAQGRALTDAAAGAPVQVQTGPGRVLRGTAQPDGSVDLPP